MDTHVYWAYFLALGDLQQRLLLIRHPLRILCILLRLVLIRAIQHISLDDEHAITAHRQQAQPELDRVRDDPERVARSKGGEDEFEKGCGAADDVEDDDGDAEAVS